MPLCAVFEPFVAGGSRLLDAEELTSSLQNAQRRHRSSGLPVKRGARLD